MKKLYWRIKNFLFLRKILKEDQEVNFGVLTHLGFKTYKILKKGGCERNQLAAAIKKYRKKNPYRIQGWDEAKKDYENYFTQSLHIPSIKTVKNQLPMYVTMYREEASYCVEPPFHYSFVSTYFKEPQVLLLTQYKKGRFIIEGDNNPFINLDKEWHTAFRYSTPEEIVKYEADKFRREEIDKQIELKRKEIEELYKNRK